MAEPVEIRFDVDRDIADILDAVSKANRMPRNALAASILKQWSDEKVHEATLVTRLARGKGLGVDA